MKARGGLAEGWEGAGGGPTRPDKELPQEGRGGTAKGLLGEKLEGGKDKKEGGSKRGGGELGKFRLCEGGGNEGLKGVMVISPV